MDVFCKNHHLLLLLLLDASNGEIFASSWFLGNHHLRKYRRERYQFSRTVTLTLLSLYRRVAFSSSLRECEYGSEREREKERERERVEYVEFHLGSPSRELKLHVVFFVTDSHSTRKYPHNPQDKTDDDDDDDDDDGANDDDARLFLDFFSRCLAVSIATEKNCRRSPQLCQTKQQQKRVVLIDNHHRSLSSKDVLRDDQLRKNAARHCIYRSEQHLQRDDCKKWY
jgi:hypothetical protein